MAKSLKTYCPLAFREIYMDSSGHYRLCCHSSSHNDIREFHNNTTTPFEFFRSDKMERIRNDMLQGNPIKGCEVCYQMEKDGNQSYREMRYIKKYNYPTDIDQVNLKIRMFGSYCNLSCYMCIPYNSSTRRKELHEIYGEEYKKIPGFSPEYNVLRANDWQRCLKDLLDNIHLIKHIHFTGGEPLQLPRHWELVDAIPDDVAKNIHLTYDTNLTDLAWKGHSIFDVQKKFAKVELEVSCDHYGEKFAWIRYPIDVKKFEDNIQKAKQIIKKLSVTVSILNIGDLLKIKNYYAGFGVRVDLTNVVRWPRILSIKNLDQVSKNKYLNMYNNISIIKHELNQPIVEQEYQQGLEYCQRLSDHRGFDHKKLWTNL